MPRSGLPLILVVASIAVWLAVSPSLVEARRNPQAPSTGLRGIAFDRPLPDVVFDNGSGPIALHTLYGKPIVINLWASWCEPCTAELGEIAGAERAYGSRFTLLTFSSEEPGVARRYLGERGFVLPIIEDPKKRVFERLGVSAVPVTFVLRADGTLAHLSVGRLDPNELRDALAPLVATPTDAATPTDSGSLRPDRR